MEEGLYWMRTLMDKLWDNGVVLKVASILAFGYGISRCIYLLYFHPLAKFPGPKLSCVSNFIHVYKWLGGSYHEHVHGLHLKYGPVVRIAPNELSFNSVESLNDIYGFPSKTGHTFIKSSFYAGINGYSTIVMERDPVKHKDTKKLMAYGFSPKELQAQEPTIRENLDLLVLQVERQSDSGEKSLPLNKLMQAFVFDTIGELALGEPFGALESMRPHPWIDTIHEAVYVMSIIQQAPRIPILWLSMPLVIPWASIGKFIRFFKHQTAMTRKRLARHASTHGKPGNREKRDLFSFLLRERPEGYSSQVVSETWLGNQAGVLIAAGFDTTAVTAVSCVYYLATHPEQQRRLREELRTRFRDASDMTYATVQQSQLPYLSACIDETMRLLPPLVFGLPRESPGAVVDGHYVPKSTVVSTSGWSITRRPDYFFNPGGFHPERWLPDSHPHADRVFANDLLEASKPFSIGPRACLGVLLAYLELRLLVARLAWEFAWALDEGRPGMHEWDRGRRFHALWSLPEVRVRFSRSRGQA